MGRLPESCAGDPLSPWLGAWVSSQQGGHSSAPQDPLSVLPSHLSRTGGLAPSRCSVNPCKRKLSSHSSLPLPPPSPSVPRGHRPFTGPPPPGSPRYSLRKVLYPVETDMVWVWGVMGCDRSVGAWRGRRGSSEGQVALGPQETPGSAEAGSGSVPGAWLARQPEEGCSEGQARPGEAVRRGPARAGGGGRDGAHPRASVAAAAVAAEEEQMPRGPGGPACGPASCTGAPFGSSSDGAAVLLSRRRPPSAACAGVRCVGKAGAATPSRLSAPQWPPAVALPASAQGRSEGLRASAVCLLRPTVSFTAPGQALPGVPRASTASSRTASLLQPTALGWVCASVLLPPPHW